MTTEDQWIDDCEYDEYVELVADFDQINKNQSQELAKKAFLGLLGSAKLISRKI